MHHTNPASHLKFVKVGFLLVKHTSWRSKSCLEYGTTFFAHCICM